MYTFIVREKTVGNEQVKRYEEIEDSKVIEILTGALQSEVYNGKREYDIVSCRYFGNQIIIKSKHKTEDKELTHVFMKM